MAKQIINIGSGQNEGDGGPIRLAFEKINSNFNELYDGTVQTLTLVGTTLSISGGNQVTLDDVFEGGLTADLTGSVFADDSTLLVDGVNGKIVGDIQNNLIETNNITALPGDTDLYIQGGIDSGTPGNPARVNIGTTNTSTIILGASDSLIYVNGNDDSIIGGGTGIFGTITGDLTGSVFGDDSTLLVDGVNGVIPYPTNAGVVWDGIAPTTVDAALDRLASYTQDFAVSTDAHWADPNPADITDAINRLAAAIYALNGNTGI